MVHLKMNEIRQHLKTPKNKYLGVCSAILDEVPRLLPADALDVRHLVPELDSVELVRVLQQLGPERGGDELRRRGELVDHVGDGFTVLGVQRLGDTRPIIIHWKQT